MGLKDFFKSKTIQPDPMAETIKQQQAGYGRALTESLNQIKAASTPQAIQTQIGSENAALQGNLADIRRRIQQNIARQGIQNSSVGLAAMTQPEQQIGRQILLNQASAPMRQLDLAERQGRLAQAGLTSQQVPINFQQQISPSGLMQLLPSLLQVGGTLGGAYLGGGAGALAGSQIGQVAGNMTNQAYNRQYQPSGLYNLGAR